MLRWLLLLAGAAPHAAAALPALACWLLLHGAHAACDDGVMLCHAVRAVQPSWTRWALTTGRL
jgi:hypothetical protein